MPDIGIARIGKPLTCSASASMWEHRGEPQRHGSGNLWIGRRWCARSDGRGVALPAPANIHRHVLRLVPGAVELCYLPRHVVCFSQQGSDQAKGHRWRSMPAERKQEEPRSVVALTTEIVAA